MVSPIYAQCSTVVRNFLLTFSVFFVCLIPIPHFNPGAGAVGEVVGAADPVVAVGGTGVWGCQCWVAVYLFQRGMPPRRR